jgi:protein gp37
MEATAIAWAKSTFNGWMGCVHVSPACEHCYAESLVRDRMGFSVSGSKKKSVWGLNADRQLTSDANWRNPLKWDREAARTGEFWPVFCASLADVFEDRRDLDPWRARLFDLIEATPHLTWLLLTKRPDRIFDLTPARWRSGCPSHVWMGTTVEDNRRADERIPRLLRVPAVVRFLSLEPQLESIRLDLAGRHSGVHWVITGGESGPKARPYNPDWARGVIAHCRAAGVAAFVKQLGTRWARQRRAKSLHGANPAEWDPELRVQEFPGGLTTKGGLSRPR